MKLKTGKLQLHLSFLFFAVATYFLSGEMGKNYICAVLFSSLHELGHLLAMKLSGCQIKQLSLEAMGIKIEKSSCDLSYKNEVIISLCGPLVNLVFIVLFIFLKKYFPVLSLPLNINLGLFFVNMLPCKALDGGRILMNILLSKFDTYKAEKIGVAVEVLVAIILVLCLILTLIFNVVNTSFVFFILSLAGMIVFDIIKS